MFAGCVNTVCDMHKLTPLPDVTPLPELVDPVPFDRSDG